MTEKNNSQRREEKHCVPCEDADGALDIEAAMNLKEGLNQWSLIDDIRIEKTLKFKDFSEALGFVNDVGAIAEAEGHHPNISLHDWNKVTLTLYTHSLNSLSENDFILAEKIDALYRKKCGESA